MQQWSSLPAAGAVREPCAVPGRQPMSATQRSLPEPGPVAPGSGQGVRLSPEAAARPAAMARIILRRVGITPLLSLMACAVVMTTAPDPASAQRAAVSTSATARVTVRSNAARLVMGQLVSATVADQLSPLALASPAPRPSELACTADDRRTVGPSCRMIVSDLP